MKVFFVYTNINGFHENCYSPGLAYIVSSTLKNGHEARVIDEIETYMPRVIGFTAVASQFSAVQ